jgi:hypothetical protein
LLHGFRHSPHLTEKSPRCNPARSNCLVFVQLPSVFT